MPGCAFDTGWCPWPKILRGHGMLIQVDFSDPFLTQDQLAIELVI